MTVRTYGFGLDVWFSRRTGDEPSRIAGWTRDTAAFVKGWEQESVSLLGTSPWAMQAMGMSEGWGLFYGDDGQTPISAVLGVFHPDGDSPLDVAATLPIVRAVAERALDDPEVGLVELWRQGMGEAPRCSLFTERAHIITLSPEAEAQLGCPLPLPGWELRGRRSLGAILTRLLDVADDAEFVQADAEHLTALARLAPGLVDGL